jgi:hypothetical protein
MAAFSRFRAGRGAKSFRVHAKRASTTSSGSTTSTGAPRTQIFSQADLAEFDVLKRPYGIATPARCGDWFMDFPLIRCSTAELAQREQHLHKLIPIAARIGANRIVSPFCTPGPRSGFKYVVRHLDCAIGERNIFHRAVGQSRFF